MELRTRAAREDCVRNRTPDIIRVMWDPRCEEVDGLGGLFRRPERTPCASAVASGDGQPWAGGIEGIVEEVACGRVKERLGMGKVVARSEV